ncbi:MAG: PHP domain-containing protein [Candidatus Kariarchaeaceae archaeon]
MRIDLHCHSTNSDGTWSVEELLKKAEQKAVQGLAITDHDNFQGSLEAHQQVDGLYSGILIPGIEISTRVKSHELHLLAYFPTFDIPIDHPLLQALEKIRESRIWRMKEMIKKAKKHGFVVSFEEVLAEAAKGIDGTEQPSDVLSRPHLARVLFSKGYVSSFDEAFDRYLANGKPLYASRFTLKIDKWVKHVKDLGGLVIWAHPFHGHEEEFSKFVSLAKILQQSKIDGVELVYDYKGKYKVSENFITKGKELVAKLIYQHNWIITAGGDFHGNVGKLGELELPEEDWEIFLEKLNWK